VPITSASLLQPLRPLPSAPAPTPAGPVTAIRSPAPAPPAFSPPTLQQPVSDHKMPVAVIAGSVLGGLAGGVLLAAAAVLVVRQMRNPSAAGWPGGQASTKRSKKYLASSNQDSHQDANGGWQRQQKHQHQKATRQSSKVQQPQSGLPPVHLSPAPAPAALDSQEAPAPAHQPSIKLAAAAAKATLSAASGTQLQQKQELLTCQAATEPSLQQPLPHVRPHSIVLPARASALLAPLRQVPQQGRATRAASAQDQVASSSLDFSTPGTGLSNPEQSSLHWYCIGQDEAPYSRAQQLALIENELKEIRQGFLSEAAASAKSVAGSSGLHAQATTPDRPQGDQTGSTGGKLSGNTSYSSAGSPAEAVIADHIPGLVLVDTLG
jgi:hypothetical protein